MRQLESIAPFSAATAILYPNGLRGCMPHWRVARHNIPDVTAVRPRQLGGRDALRRDDMNFERYTDRAKGFVQAAQSLALREGHQQFSPEHLLKVLLDDAGGPRRRPDRRAGGRPREALAAVERVARQAPEGLGRRRRPALPRARARPRLRRGREDRREGRRQVRHRRAAAAGARARASAARPARILTEAGVTAQALNAAINEIRKGRTADSASPSRAMTR